MRSLRISTCFCLALALALCARELRAENFEIQAVSATDPGKKNAQIPDTLARYRGELAMHAFGGFADAGTQTVTLSAAAPKSSAQVGKFTLELNRQGHCKMEVTVKEGAKVVLGPIGYAFGKEKTKQLQLPDGKKTLIVFLTLTKE